MLKVLIVDDEKIQREGIHKHISWQKYDMRVIGCASDGFEALEIARQHRPDILITDVKMPKMDGLELSRKVREFLPEARVLIISGYEEFEIARKAIELNADAFTLKPVDIDEMGKTLAKITSLCISKRQAEEEISVMKQQLAESKPFLTDKFVKDIIFGNIKDENTILKRAEVLSLSIPENRFHVADMQVEYEFDGTMQGYDQLYYFNISKYLADDYGRLFNSLSTQIKDNEFALIFFDDDGSEDISIVIENLKRNMMNRFNVTVTLGVSDRKNSLSLANDGYREAVIALKEKFYLGKGSIILFKDVKNYSCNSVGLDEIYSDLVEGMRIGDVDTVERLLEEVFTGFAQSLSYSERYIKAFCFRTMSDAYRALYEINEKMENIFGEEDMIWNKIFRFDTIPDVRQWVTNVITTVTRYIFCKRSGRSKNVVNAILQILEEKYSEQFTIEDIAERVFLTPNYICSVFKESTGESIINYLTKIRLRHAKQLLADNSLKIYEIAERTGFNSTTYFSIVFKNAFGISPKEYKNLQV